jgi:hypothetical protein
VFKAAHVGEYGFQQVVYMNDKLQMFLHFLASKRFEQQHRIFQIEVSQK